MKRVLIVDDAVFMRLSLRQVLVRNGFEVVGEAENGLDAVKKYKACKPDIVTMDITMPDLDGLGALRAIRTINPDAKVVMVSSMGQESIVKEAIMLGARTFIVKPFKEEHVIKTLSSILGIA